MVEAESQKIKVDLGLRVLTAYINVQEAKTVKVFWARGTQSVSSKTVQLDPANNCIAQINNKFNCRPSLRYTAHSDTWLPDVNTITLFCDEEKVAECKFDISRFLNQGNKTIKAEIQPESYFNSAVQTEDIVL